MSEWPTCICGCGRPVVKHQRYDRPTMYAKPACRGRLHRSLRSPQVRESVRKYHREKWREYRAANADEVRERERLNRRRRMLDPKYRARYNELARLRHAEQRQREGHRMRRSPVIDQLLTEETPQRLPVAPVVVWIDRLVERCKASEAGVAVGVTCERLGIDPRNFSAWRRGERDEVQFDVLDRMLTNGDVLWWEVYDQELFPEEYEQARAVFEPDEDMVA